MTSGQRPKATKTLLEIQRGLSETDVSLINLLDFQGDDNPFIKNVIQIPDVLDLNGANNETPKLYELALQHHSSLKPFSG
jgi:hypothetical protein